MGGEEREGRRCMGISEGEKRFWDDPKMHSGKERTMNGERCGWGGGTGG